MHKLAVLIVAPFILTGSLKKLGSWGKYLAKTQTSKTFYLYYYTDQHKCTCLWQPNDISHSYIYLILDLAPSKHKLSTRYCSLCIQPKEQDEDQELPLGAVKVLAHPPRRLVRLRLRLCLNHFNSSTLAFTNHFQGSRFVDRSIFHAGMFFGPLVPVKGSCNVTAFNI